MQLSVPAFPKLALMLGVMGLLAGLAISFVVTPRYVSQAEMTFHSVTNSTPPDVRRNLTERLVQFENEILSRTSLSNIIQDPHLDLYKKERTRTPLEDVIERMRTRDLRIRVETAGQDYLSFQVSFAYSDRLKAQQTVQVLITEFVEANLYSQQSQAQATRVIASDQVYRLEERIAALEKRLGMPSASHGPDFSPVPFGGTQPQRARSSEPSRPTGLPGSYAIHGCRIRRGHSRGGCDRCRSTKSSTDTFPRANGVTWRRAEARRQRRSVAPHNCYECRSCRTSSRTSARSNRALSVRLLNACVWEARSCCALRTDNRRCRRPHRARNPAHREAHRYRS